MTLTRDQIGTRYVLTGIRTFIDPGNPKDVEQVHTLRDAITVSQASPGRFDVPDWDHGSRKKVRTAASSDGTPVMHACGHDAHVTWLLGITKVMAGMRDQWSGTLILVAQPAEELVLGAQGMIDDGLYTKHAVPKPDFFLALHTMPVPFLGFTRGSMRRVRARDAVVSGPGLCLARQKIY